MTVDDHCPTCGQPVPIKPPPASTASPMPRFVVDVTEQVGARRVHWPGFDPGGDYSGAVVIPLDTIYAVKLNKVSVFPTRWGNGEYLEHAELLTMAKTTVDRPDQVAPVTVSLTKRREKRARTAAAQPEGKPA